MQINADLAAGQRWSDDVALLGRWRLGDEDAGQRLFERHFDDIYRFFRNKCGDAADDLVQRTFLACIQARERFRGDSSFRTYLFGIARNELLSYLRRHSNDGDKLDFGVTSLGEIVTTPATKLARDQASERLRIALTQLSVDEQLLLELSYWHDMDATALGQIFEVPPATIRTRLRRARLALHETLVESESGTSR
ncbi:MAG TPA: sigma-70 family RNA polymerase sigma factor [Kofleriaceae bacterium]